MRRMLATSVVLFATATAAVSHDPFSPFEHVPDHVVTMATRAIGRDGAIYAGSRTVTRHASWSRLDVVEHGRPATRFYGHTDSVRVNFARDISGAFSNLNIVRGRYPESILIRDSFRTGETQTVLGETCHVWHVMRAGLQRPTETGLTRLNCVTDDGIELWYKLASGNREIRTAEATRVERRAVQPADARPPVEGLDLRNWNELIEPTSMTPTGLPGDFEAIIEPERETAIPQARVTRIVRRHHPWTSTDGRLADGGRMVRVRNEISRFDLLIEIDGKTGLRRLAISKLPPPASDITTSVTENPPDLGRGETILGEPCRWLDATAPIREVILHKCQTADGVVLKELLAGWGVQQMYVATRLTRRSIALSEVLPPDLLAPRAWGLPE